MRMPTFNAMFYGAERVAFTAPRSQLVHVLANAFRTYANGTGTLMGHCMPELSQCATQMQKLRLRSLPLREKRHWWKKKEKKEKIKRSNDNDVMWARAEIMSLFRITLQQWEHGVWSQFLVRIFTECSFFIALPKWVAVFHLNTT